MKQSIQLGTLSVVNIGIAFLFQWYVLTQLGPGMETDALFAGMTLPQLVLAVISGSLMHVLVPLLAGEDEDRLRHDAWGFLVLVGGLFGLLATILYVTAPWWIPITVPGFSDAGRTLTVDLTRIQLIGMVFTAINGVQWATYHARQQFVRAEFTPILASTFSLLLLIWALPRFGVVAAAWISTLRMALQTLLLAPGMGKPVCPNLKSVAIQQAWQRIKPLLLGTVYYKTDPLVDRFLLSTASSGSLSL
ncbi:MAG: lipid II flippase MurJ, partial [Deltaproteobacteria bacterium]